MSAPGRNGQAAADKRRATHFTWAEFDALPRVIRDLMNYTPHAVGTGYVFRQLQAGAPLRVVARDASLRWARYARQETLRLYGPAHPQASVPQDPRAA